MVRQPHEGIEGLLQGPFQHSLMVLLLFLHMRAEHMAPSLSVNAFPLLGMEKHL